MLLCAQFPLADVRPFAAAQTRRISQPSRFVRRAGMEVGRVGGGVAGWPAEDEFWSAGHAVRYDDHLDARSFGPWSPARFAGAFRRLFWDDAVLPRARVELALTNTGGGRDRRRRSRGSAATFDAPAGQRIVDDFLTMPIRIARHGRLEDHRLCDAGDALACLVRDATTQWKDAGEFAPERWWVRAGRPLCLVEYGFTEGGEPPERATEVCDEDTLALHFARLRAGRETWPVWFLRIRDPGSPDIRLMRLHLLRLHAETETLRQVLELLADPSGAVWIPESGPVARAFDDYLAKALGVLSRSAHYGWDTSALLEAAYGIREEVAADVLADVEGLVDRAAARRPILAQLLDQQHEARRRLELTAVVYPEGPRA